jgi:hypothetical protein
MREELIDCCRRRLRREILSLLALLVQTEYHSLQTAAGGVCSESGTQFALVKQVNSVSLAADCCRSERFTCFTSVCSERFTCFTSVCSDRSSVCSGKAGPHFAVVKQVKRGPQFAVVKVYLLY